MRNCISIPTRDEIFFSNPEGYWNSHSILPSGKQEIYFQR
jgi:hypothetical protein